MTLSSAASHSAVRHTAFTDRTRRLLPLDVSAALNIQTQALLREDPELGAVWMHLREIPLAEQRFARTLRDTIDQLLNGEDTGRYDWQSLYKTEKTHAGTLVEIKLQREFKFEDGIHMDYRIADIDVDCKYSQQFGGWMIPPEARGHLCLLVWADDKKSQWSAGLFRVKDEWLNRGNNRDLKLTVKAEHRNKIAWLWRDAELPENVLLHMSDLDRDAVFAYKSGQARLNELFRRVQHRRIGRNVVRTVAQQKDYMKRVRGNGGSRSALRHEGILIMGDYESHRSIASALGIPVPQEGEFVSSRVVEVTAPIDRHSVMLDGRLWACASPEDLPAPGPSLPSHSK
ncbi:NaeI family type II restriction endonuclease [Streptomyces sp. NPDC048266]|uniref:NaeI family type II restriction endonuclease n=1 Tax=Streptomyces sp. NPDC048266 TaxID=3155787 RepID=UPI0033ECC696